MTQFATAGDLAARLGVDLSSAEQTRANTLLQLASGLIQREARQRIELVTNDVLTVPGVAESRLRLPERPVVSVTTVTLDGTAVTAGEDTIDYYLNGSDLIRPKGWGWGEQVVQVTYTHGYSTIPDAIVAVCLEAVTRVWVNPGNLMHEYYGSERTVHAMQEKPSGLLLNNDEQRVVHDVLRRTVGTVVLR